MQPQVIKKKTPLLKECSCCHTQRPGGDFLTTDVWLYSDGLIPVCNSCIKDILIKAEWNWVAVDKLCQMIDIPFIPKEFERLHEINGDDVFSVYAKIFQSSQFEGLGWADYFAQFMELKKLGLIENELPRIHEAKIKQMKEIWGGNYDEESLTYLENLFLGMLATQNINGALQTDQARKLCKISLEIDQRIRAGIDFDKLMGSYDKMVKTAEFTPKNAKNENDIDSFAEAAAWLEKRGWVNTYFDDVSRDIVDEVTQNLQAFNQRLYVNESGIGEEITARIEALKVAQHMESSTYDLQQDFDLEKYDNEGYENLVKEEFIVDDDSDDNFV